MPGAPLTEAQIREILAEPMRIDGPVRWSQKTAAVWVEAALAVKHPSRAISLSVRLTLNLLAQHKFSLSLLLDSAHRVVGVDVGGAHENRHTDTNRWVNQPHEHVWTDLCHGGWARELDPFPTSVREALPAFCERLGIEFAGIWTDPPPTQLELEI